MSDQSVPQLRNVVLVGPSGGGKTTVVEAILAATGAISRAGTVLDGSTVTDHEEVEKRLGKSVALSVATTLVTDDGLTGGNGPVRLTLLDSPGSPDFVGELRAGLRAADAAVFVVSAVDGVDASTRALWAECAAVTMPRIIVVTHVDQQRGDEAAAVRACRDVFGDGVQPLYHPAPDLDGMVGLLSQTLIRRSGGSVERTPYEAPETDRAALIEGIITESEDEGMLDRYLGGEEVGFDTLVSDLEKAVATGRFHPMLPVVPTTGLGVPELIEVICRGLPAAVEHVMPRVYNPDGVELAALTGSADGPLVAEVVRTTTDSYVGRQSLVRVFSGTLHADRPVHVSGHFARFSGDADDEIRHPDHDLDERAGALALPLGNSGSPVAHAPAGSVVTVARLTHAETGDTLSDPGAPCVLPPWDIPHPMLAVAIAASSPAEEDRMMSGLARIQAEDPTVRVEVDRQTGQLLLWVLGEQHLDVVLDRLRTRHSVTVQRQDLIVPMTATVRGRASAVGRHVKQSGGHGQYAIAELEIEPLPLGSGFEFVDKVVGGAVPRQFIPSVEKGVRAQLLTGVDSYPIVDVRVTLVGGKAHSVDSSDAAFQMAGALGLKEACSAAGLLLLEPTEVVRVTVDDEFLGAALADLSVRRAHVQGTEPAVDGGRTTITAEVPSVELTRYAVDLRSIAKGTGSWTRSPGRSVPAPVATAR